MSGAVSYFFQWFPEQENLFYFILIRLRNVFLFENINSNSKYLNKTFCYYKIPPFPKICKIPIIYTSYLKPSY